MEFTVSQHFCVVWNWETIHSVNSFGVSYRLFWSEDSMEAYNNGITRHNYRLLMHKFSLKRELTPAVNSPEYCGGEGGCRIIMNNATERNVKLGPSF